MENKKLEQENEQLKSQVEQLESKLDAIEKSNQKKTKFQLWLGRVGFGFLLGAGLKSSMRQLYQELPNKVQKDTVADVTTNVIWRLTRIGLFGILIALIPTVLLWRQNQLFEKQNLKIDDQTKLFEKQNDKIDSQIQLEESSRRGNLIEMMSNIMDKVDEELRRDPKSRKLSQQLIGRISALSYAFRPYRFLQDSTLIEKPLSPERGQLLLALVNSDLDSLTYRNIYQEATFEQAYLEKANLNGANLKKVNLKRAYLKGANLENTNLTMAKLENANLEGTNLRTSNLNSAIFIQANLNKAFLFKAVLVKANLMDTNLTDSTFKGAYLRGAFLAGADLRGTNLVFTDLTGAVVKDKNWLKKIQDLKVIGKYEILKNYKLDGNTTSHQKFLGLIAGGKPYYEVKKKESGGF